MDSEVVSSAGHDQLARLVWDQLSTKLREPVKGVLKKAQLRDYCSKREP